MIEVRSPSRSGGCCSSASPPYKLNVDNLASRRKWRYHYSNLVFLFPMTEQNSLKLVTVGRLTPAELYCRLSQPGRDARILGEIICAIYWGGTVQINLQMVETLSQSNWNLAVEIMGYRRSRIWSEPQFRIIALWCRERFALSQWDSED